MASSVNTPAAIQKAQVVRKVHIILLIPLALIELLTPSQPADPSNDIPLRRHQLSNYGRVTVDLLFSTLASLVHLLLSRKK